MAKSFSISTLKKGLLSVTAVAGTLLWATQGFAAPITGQLDIAGTDDFTNTSVTFPTGTANIPNALATTGSYDALDGSCIGCVAINNVSTATLPGFLVYTATLNGATAKFTTTSMLSFTPISIAPNFHGLFVVGQGTAELTGFDPTPASFSLSTQCNSSGCNNGTITVSFSGTTLGLPIPAPEPASLALLGSALLGFGVLRRRRNAA